MKRKTIFDEEDEDEDEDNFWRSAKLAADREVPKLAELHY